MNGDLPLVIFCYLVRDRQSTASTDIFVFNPTEPETLIFFYLHLDIYDSALSTAGMYTITAGQ